jgi:hypothetical protein
MHTLVMMSLFLSRGDDAFTWSCVSQVFVHMWRYLHWTQRAYPSAMLALTAAWAMGTMALHHTYIALSAYPSTNAYFALACALIYTATQLLLVAEEIHVWLDQKAKLQKIA